MVSGTYVLTDSIDKAFDAIFAEIYSGTDATITGKSPFDVTRDRAASCPPFADTAHRRGAGAARRRRRDRRRRRRRAADRQRRQGDRLRRRAEPRLQRRPGQAGVQHADARERRVARRRTRSSSTKSTARRRTSRSARRIGVQAQGPVRELRDLRARQVRLGRLDRRRDARRVRPADGAGAVRQGRASSTRSASPPSPASRRSSSSPRSRRSCPPGTQVRTGDAAGGRGRQGHERVHLVPPQLPARLRRHRALRRRVRDRELALDHDRPAHARVRDAAHARRVPAPGAPARSIIEALVMGVSPRSSGCSSGSRLAKGLFKLFEAVGFTLPNSGLVFSRADGRRLAARSGSS